MLAVDSILSARFSPPYDRRVSAQPTSNEKPSSPESANGGRFSLHSLSAAFARLTGTASPATTEETTEDDTPTDEQTLDSQLVSPRMIVEGMLFVGSSEGRPLTSREIAAHIRDVSPREVETLIDELNQFYAQSGTSYRIVSDGPGFRLSLDSKFEGTRQRFFGRVREAKLTPAAIEVLAIVAYRQPIDAKQVGKLRGARSITLLNQLVRRGLIRMDRPEEAPRTPSYRTTDRFNALFRIGGPQDLPSSEDLDDC